MIEVGDKMNGARLLIAASGVNANQFWNRNSHPAIMELKSRPFPLAGLCECSAAGRAIRAGAGSGRRR